MTERVQVDNDSVYIDKMFDTYALNFSRPSKPTDNPYIESFNGSCGDECLKVYLVLSPADAQDKIKHWHREYNGFRLHSSLQNLMSYEIVAIATIVELQNACSANGRRSIPDFLYFTLA